MGFQVQDRRCINYKDQYGSVWYVWLLLLIFLIVLLCGVMLFCIQCWLRPKMDSPRCTVAVYAIGDIDPKYGTEAAVSPTVGIHLQTQNPGLYHIPCFGISGPPPPYEEVLKSSSF
ncbi:transmembrane protein 207 [Sorex araneus]|uniref:transmembrane protein 207 n=1 Tax=Sorex araneus TaxID=42254 RepID=UPI00243390FB|nr:transmembrane protein 207 [Sorex araneus]